MVCHGLYLSIPLRAASGLVQCWVAHWTVFHEQLSLYYILWDAAILHLVQQQLSQPAQLSLAEKKMHAQ